MTTKLLTSILVCLLLYNSNGSLTVASQPVMVASPPEIDVGLSDTLDVNCTVSVAGWSSVAALISLTISRNNSQTGWTELAIVSDFSNGQANVMTTENLVSNGWFNPSGSASISLHWDHATDQQVGNYICVAEGLKPIGHSLVSHTAVQVSAHTPAALSDIQNKLREMDNQMKQSQDKIKALEREVIGLKKLELEVSVLQSEKQNSISQMFEASRQYQNHTYYVSRIPFYDIHVSRAICRTYGGYLAEIDDNEESHDVKLWLRSKSMSGIRVAYISGTDLGHEGNWTLFSGKPLPFEDWAPGEPANLDNQDCMGIREVPGHRHRMAKDYCHWDEPQDDHRFICEVP